MLYKLSTVLLNIERFKNENPVVFDGSEISEHQFMEKIIDFIFQDNFQDTSWTIFDQFEYTPEEKKLIISGFKALRLHWENESSVFQEFFQELLDENINNILENNPNYDGIFLSDSSVAQRTLQVVNSQQNDNINIDTDGNESSDFVSIEIYPDTHLIEEFKISAPKYGIKIIIGDNILLEGNLDKVKYFILTEYDQNFDFSDYDKKDFDITNFEITDEILSDTKIIEGNFSFNCDNDYTTGSFTYDDENTVVYGLDSEYQKEFDQQETFYNELLVFVENNVDIDLFYEPEISELEILTETFVENEGALYIKGEISFQYGDGNDYELSYKFYEDDSIELEDIKPFDDNSDEFYKQENIFSDFLKAHLDIDVFENVIAANGEPINYNDTWDFSETELSKMEQKNSNSDMENKIMSIFSNINAFPNPLVSFYYPFNNVKSEFSVPFEKLKSLFINLLELEKEINSLTIVNNIKEKTGEIINMDYGDFLTLLMENIPNSELTQEEDVLYMDIPFDDIKLKINVGAQIWDELKTLEK